MDGARQNIRKVIERQRAFVRNHGLGSDVEVRHQWPYDFGPSTGRLAVIQPWEFGAIPAEWIDPIRRNVDEVWVPSEYVKRMYVAGGIEADRVAVVPNGVDSELFAPDGARFPLDAPDGTRFLFVGGLIERKAPELLVAAYLDAFQGRDDVCLVIKSSGAGEIYADADLGRLGEYERQRMLPRIVHIDQDLSDEQMAALHRACDVMVLPYRGEGFCMPALEAMASGLPVIATAGGPTDEFVPEAAGWRIPSTVRQIPGNQVDQWQTASPPFMLEPDVEALRDLMLEADRDREGRRLRGLAGRRAVEGLTWDAVAALYRERIAILAARPPRALSEPAAPFPLEGDAGAKLLAMPAWLGEDRLDELLLAWTRATNPGQSACLYLVADRRLHGAGDHLAERVMAAASTAGADLDAGADITIVVQPLRPGLEPALHAAAGGFVRLHGADAGAARDAAQAGNVLLDADADAIAAWLAATLRAAA